MKKSLIKKICLLLVLIISVDSFAAVVSDNDGSAFITKSEFDSLKSNFQSQIDNYNTSIDNKIDTAIASYLAGITVKLTSTVALISQIDVEKNKGYRAYNESYLSERVDNIANWFFGDIVATCGSGNWQDRSTGKVSIQRSTSGGSTNLVGYIKKNGSSSYNTQSTQLIHPTVSVQCAGKYASPYNENYPLIFTNKAGVITNYCNKRILMVDTRYFRGTDSASGENRQIFAANVNAGAKPSYTLMTLNETKELSGQGGANWNYASSGGGNVFPALIAEKKEYTFNNNLFCWNLSDTTLCNAFLDEVKEAYINSYKACTSLTNQSTMQLTAVVKAETWSGTATGSFSAVVPEIRFAPLAKSTTLPSSAFETLPTGDARNDYYKRVYLKELSTQIQAGNKNVKVYEGVPLYTTSKEGKLAFYIKASTGSGVKWNDPNANICLRIKDSPFTINDDYSKCLSVKVENPTTKIVTTTKEPVISANISDKTRLVVDMEKDKTLYMRWYCQGYNYGGEINFLGDAEFTG